MIRYIRFTIKNAARQTMIITMIFPAKMISLGSKSLLQLNTNNTADTVLSSAFIRLRQNKGAPEGLSSRGPPGLFGSYARGLKPHAVQAPPLRGPPVVLRKAEGLIPFHRGQHYLSLSQQKLPLLDPALKDIRDLHRPHPRRDRDRWNLHPVKHNGSTF